MKDGLHKVTGTDGRKVFYNVLDNRYNSMTGYNRAGQYTALYPYIHDGKQWVSQVGCPVTPAKSKKIHYF